MDSKNTITVGQLKKLLEAFPEEKELYFGGLEFYRLKDREVYVQIEFNQSVFTDQEGNVIIENHK